MIELEGKEEGAEDREQGSGAPCQTEGVGCQKAEEMHDDRQPDTEFEDITAPPAEGADELDHPFEPPEEEFKEPARLQPYHQS
jgi:hypothetical protein